MATQSSRSFDVRAKTPAETVADDRGVDTGADGAGVEHVGTASDDRLSDGEHDGGRQNVTDRPLRAAARSGRRQVGVAAPNRFALRWRRRVHAAIQIGFPNGAVCEAPAQ